MRFAIDCERCDQPAEPFERCESCRLVDLQAALAEIRNLAAENAHSPQDGYTMIAEWAEKALAWKLRAQDCGEGEKILEAEKKAARARRYGLTGY